MTTSSSPCEPAERPLPIKIFIAYQNAAAGRRAAGVANTLLQQLGAVPSGRAAIWRFDVLENEAALRAADREAREADILIFASDNSGQLPSGAARCRQGAVTRKPGDQIVVDLGGTGPEWNLEIDWQQREPSLALAD